MNLEIGYLPRKYYEYEPSTGGYQFFINEGIQSAVNIIVCAPAAGTLRIRSSTISK